MNIKNYRVASVRTLVSLGSKKQDGAHMAMGITTEIEELKEGMENQDLPNIIEELGDILWYISGECQIYDLNMVDIEFQSTLLKKDRKPFRIEKLVDLHKSEFAYNEEMSKSNIEKSLSILMADLNDISSRYGFTIYEAMQVNIDKLKVRYPGKFTNDKAINRDLESEKKILENAIARR